MIRQKSMGLVVWLSLLVLTACAPSTLYHWGDYDQTLYNHYESPEKSAKFAENLSEIIVDAEKKGRVPPGMYAEYGYVLYEAGNDQEAVRYFQKEYDLWPESRLFMRKMIRNAERRSKTTKAPSTTTRSDI